MKQLLFISSLLMLISSCKKEGGPIQGDLLYLVGDYDYLYTKISDTEYIINQDLSDQYGMRITEDNKMYFFKNGKQSHKYDLIGQSKKDYSGMDYIHYKIDRKTSYPLFYSGDTLIHRAMPMEGGYNYFINK